MNSEDNFFRYWGRRLWLNVRALRLAAQNRWLTTEDARRSYDALAADYDAAWLVRLRGATDDFLRRAFSETPIESNVASNRPNAILDLGCGSGYSTEFLARRFPNAKIVGVDVSEKMLDEARRRLEFASNVELIRDDMLAATRDFPANSFDVVVSCWAIGYSRPKKIVEQARRILRGGGRFAVLVNRLDTLPAVFQAFRETTRRFPGDFQKAVVPHFPKSAKQIAKLLNRNGFQTEFLEESAVPISLPDKKSNTESTFDFNADSPDARLDWLLKTGVLAGFDSVAPLATPGRVRDFFAAKLAATDDGWEHRDVFWSAIKQI